MEQPSVTLSATQSVDYLGQTHDWSATDVIYTYKEITRQLAACREKIREENEQKLTAPKAPSSKQQPKNVKEQATRRQLAHQQSSSPQSQQQRTPGNKVIGNISRQLQQQKHESALRAEEKRLIRMQNSLWRRMGPTVGCVGKGNKLVSPRTLKW
ncbi:11482_t:CDS:1 [Acaulospora colombiana]|uniref:11482_t:CDS:1 n=1 Tax=Acaulospora colombiana TaxID=27376 RepID=A0ACA9LQM8_9GLOM|nr:11482_t:CDS:1 [Acaulospora colombiana]